MVLGNMQLGVLRKLKELGPMKSGLHPTVHSLERAGFVTKMEEVYSLSETGQLALIAFDEMDEFHRQILMQVNRAIANKEMYNADAFKTKAEKDAFDDLLLWELVDVDDDGDITLLESGRVLWNVWTQAHALRPEAKPEVLTVSEVAIVTPPITAPTSAGECPDCSSCLDAEVLRLIAAKYPKVAELRDTLLKEKQLLKELGL